MPKEPSGEDFGDLLQAFLGLHSVGMKGVGHGGHAGYRLNQDHLPSFGLLLQLQRDVGDMSTLKKCAIKEICYDFPVGVPSIKLKAYDKGVVIAPRL